MSWSEHITWYPFTLADESEWAFGAEDELSDWMARFAAVLKLEEGPTTNTRKIFFRQDPPYSPGWITQELRHLRVWSHADWPGHIIQIPPGQEENPSVDFFRMREAIGFLCTELLSSGALPLHAALLSRENHGIVIAAPGGTGKSTCAARAPPPWRALGDDMTLVVRDMNGAYHAHPLPTWSDITVRGYTEWSWDLRKSQPLRGVYFLEQADQDGMVPVGQGEATAGITASAIQIIQLYLWHIDTPIARRFRADIFANASNLVCKVPAFRLSATRHGRFWEEIERSMASSGGR
ncbi:SynChlorMet cassette protein ScmC [Methanofollis aquaemaris]|uniref:SynChlorMet cassette protein ScmC n=1 Tax=Methanofollis aquaemaris TaxID=126734 RepID=A0A8A3S4S2_9EURY|nr:SynChlorMet cassette protein ScmC [Methanofollis aquaemaris]QSZ66690.1 SynChlorMet cassette protein ScmC [Methanofollis aquaemaris]